MEQVLYNLPDGWNYTELAALCKFENGDRGRNYPSRDAFVESGIPVKFFVNMETFPTDEEHMIIINSNVVMKTHDDIDVSEPDILYTQLSMRSH